MRESKNPDNKICSNFTPPIWCKGGHRQTILSNLLRPAVDIGADRIRINTPDQDFLDMDLKVHENSEKVAILFHGLEGSSKRYYITRFARVLYQNGYSIVAVNFRSCSGDMNRKRRFYHSGEIDDLDTAFQWTVENFQNCRLFAAGYSLGASCLLNYLRRYQTAHPLQAVAAISTPFDLKKGSLNLDSGFNRIYNLYFLRSLAEKAKIKRMKYPDIPEFTGKTLYEFDDQITAPLHGFEDADDYYETCSSAFFMHQIQSPVLIIHSKHDPLCPLEYTPVDEIRKNRNLEPCFVDKGGHVGFWSKSGHWLERNILKYFDGF